MGIRDEFYLTNDKRQECDDLKDRIVMLLTAATSTTKPMSPCISGKNTGGRKDRHTSLMVKVIELEAKLAEKQYAYEMARVALTLSVSQVPDKARPVFVEKYCQGKSLNEVARSQKQSKRNICKILKKFEKNY